MRADTLPPARLTLGALDIGTARCSGLHGQPAAGAAEHRHLGDDDPAAAAGNADHHGHRSIGPGFNPHLLSDQSPVNAAISALVLPSSFRPVPDPNTPTGSRWELDPTLLVSAEVTSQNPFTVTYKIRPEARGRITRRSPPTTTGTCGGRWSVSRAWWTPPAMT